MKKIFTSVLFLAAIKFSFAQTILTQWNFTNESTNPNVGAGTISYLGGITTVASVSGYNGSSVEGTALNTTSYPAANVGSGTAGVAFMSSTNGRSGITVSYDVRHSTSPSKYSQIFYTVDGGNWTLFDIEPSNTTITNTMDGAAISIDATNNMIVNANSNTWGRINLNMSAIAGINDNPNFGFKVVTVFDPANNTSYTGTLNPYASTGTIRFDNVTINYSSVLPLNLTSFKAAYNGRSAQLTWTSANEVNVKGFSIEKSGNGNQFTEVGFVAAKNASLTNTYTFADARLLNGANHYRLKMVDKDGASRYSNVVTLNSRNTISAQVFPNPTRGNLIVSHPVAQSGSTIRLVNLAGKTIKNLRVETGAIQTSLNVSSLATGNYLVVFINSGEQSVTKFTRL